MPITVNVTRKSTGVQVCFPQPLPAPGSAVAYRATVFLALAANYTLLNGTVRASAPNATLVYVADVACRDQQTAVATPPAALGGIVAQTRTITVAMPIPSVVNAVGVLPAIFVDSSTCGLVSASNNNTFVVSLASCRPALAFASNTSAATSQTRCSTALCVPLCRTRRLCMWLTWRAATSRLRLRRHQRPSEGSSRRRGRSLWRCPFRL
ncbi:Hypothetical protein, putative [Bodo saltans]|uniref:Uncharacterized protein n=1 Tax=Bodo saltans TaxID=75058 RepID=A0A0S4ITE3_BODSA|nr:Hypothetical protein, putative [Bodo saltans]|eukprot:CUG06532.1 Hypothetical protein, putative [Bodo saltans]